MVTFCSKEMVSFLYGNKNSMFNRYSNILCKPHGFCYETILSMMDCFHSSTSWQALIKTKPSSTISVEWFDVLSFCFDVFIRSHSLTDCICFRRFRVLQFLISYFSS